MVSASDGTPLAYGTRVFNYGDAWRSRYCTAFQIAERILMFDVGSKLISKYYWMAALFCYLVAYYFPLTAKSNNNIFYIGLAFPSFVWFLRKPDAIFQYCKSFKWFFVPFLILSFVLSIKDSSFVADSMYVLLYFIFFGAISREKDHIQKGFLGFALVSVVVLGMAVAECLLVWAQTEVWTRVTLQGGSKNPIFAALMIITALTFIWVFYADDYLNAKSVFLWSLGFSVFVILCALCIVVFQARSAIVGFGLFILMYLIKTRRILFGFFVVSSVMVLFFYSGVGGVLLDRGLSYRTVIWADAVNRLVNDCNLLFGCGKDGYRFSGQFYHPHSAYVSTLYHGGIVALVLLLFLLAEIWRRGWASRSKWLLVAMVGWGGVLTDTAGVITSPRALWVFFWLPTLMTAIDIGRRDLEGYFNRRCDRRA